MTKSKFLALFTAMVLLLSLPAAAALAQVPALPHTFVGSVMMGEEMAADGTMVVAMIDGEKAGSAEVMDGKYRLQISLEGAPADDTVSFMVGEMDAMETGMYMEGDGR